MRLGPTLYQTWSGLLLALALVAGAAAATVLMSRALAMEPPMLALFYAAVTLAAYFCGLWPGIFAAVLSAVLIDLVVSEPLLGLALSVQDLVRVLSFLLVAVLISFVTEQRRRALLSRQEGERRFRVMADAAPVLIWMSGADKGGDYFNRPWLRFTGRTIEQEAGSGWMEGVHPDDRDTLQICQQAFNNHEPFEMEFRLRRHDGEYRWMLDRGTPRFSASGEFLGYIGSCLDITERKLAEHDAVEREARLTAILETAIDGIITIDDHGIMQTVNPAAERIFGYSREELIGRNVRILMPSPDRDQHDQYVRNYLETGVPKIIGIGREVVGLRKSGETFPMHLGVTEMRVDDRRMFTGIVRDISAQKQAEQQLRESEARFRMLFEGAPVGVAIARHGRLLFANPAMVRMFGYDSVQQLLGQPVTRVVTPESREQVLDRMMRRERGEAVESEYELVGIRRDGTQFPYLVQARRIELSDGPATIAFCIDLTQRKQAEEVIHRHQAEIRALVENAPDIITRFDRQFRHLYANPAVERVTGIPLDQIIGKTNRELGMDPRLCDLWEQKYEQTFREKREINFEFSYESAGQVRHFDARLVPEYEPDGSVPTIMGIVRDTTERRRAEEALRNSETRFRTVIEQSPLSIQILDREGFTLQANAAWEHLWETTRDKLDGYNILRDPQLEAKGIAPLLRRAYAGEAVQLGPIYYDPAENGLPGRPRWTEAFVYPITNEHDEVVEVVLVHQDVTKRMEIERERAGLLAAERKARAEAEAERKRAAFLAEASATLASSLDYRVTLRAVGRLALPEFADACAIDLLEEERTLRQVVLAHVDPQLEELARELRRKYPPDADQPGPLHEVLHTGRGQVVAEIDPAMIAASARDEEHLRSLQRFQIRSFIVVPLIARERTMGVMTFITSATSERRYEQEDLKLAEELARRAAVAVDNARLYHEAQEANRMKDEFLATVSHELRTPLNAILGWAQLLRTGRIDTAELHEGLEIIERNASIQSQLIADLLDVSRIITGRLRLEVRPMDLSQVIDAAIESVTPAARAKEIKIRRQVGHEAGLISGDPQRMQQVIWNLLSNSIKFTPRGGAVDVSLERIGSQVQILVRDTGQGIAPDFLPHVFERFRQADATASRTHGGLGLGLSIVRHLVELHGGTVIAESAGEGQGATFIVRLPVLSIQPSPSPEAPAIAAGGDAFRQNAPRLEGLHILVVDDEPDARNLIRTVLQQCGAVVETAATAEQAMQYLRQNRPDVMVSDIGMPGEDGYSLIRRIRSSEVDGQHLPAVALTAYARTEDRLRALSAGYQSHVVKPVNADELVTVIASVTGRTI